MTLAGPNCGRPPRPPTQASSKPCLQVWLAERRSAKECKVSITKLVKLSIFKLRHLNLC